MESCVINRRPPAGGARPAGASRGPNQARARASLPVLLLLLLLWLPAALSTQLTNCTGKHIRAAVGAARYCGAPVLKVVRLELPGNLSTATIREMAVTSIAGTLLNDSFGKMILG